MEQPSLTLYVAGGTERADAAGRGLRRLREELLGGRAHLEVVDVLSDPDRARADGVHVTPTVTSGSGRGAARVFGDLSDPHQVLWSLGISCPPRS